MKVLIRMVSGEEKVLETKYTSIKKWINANFSSDKNFTCYLPNTNSSYALKFNNIESIEIEGVNVATGKGGKD